MSKQSVLVTGANGGIGKTICRLFSSKGYHVIASGRGKAAKDLVCGAYLELDLNQFCSEEKFRIKKISDIKSLIEGTSFKALVNNAACQIVKPVAQVTYSDLLRTMNVNVFAPYILAQSLCQILKTNKGCVVNISSIHAALTKPEFSAYSISKAAMDGMTRALAVELGNEVRLNAISPAAISTPMLEDGFKDQPEEFGRLAIMHPTGEIGKPEDVASMALFLISENAAFVNGSILGLDGGIRGRLHDPI